MRKKESLESVMPDVAYYLELLKTRAFLETQKAVERKDESLLRTACDKVDVPENIRLIIIKVLLKDRMLYE